MHSLKRPGAYLRRTLGKYAFYFLLLLLWTTLSVKSSGAAKPYPPLGVWITVFTPEKVFYSKENADRLIETCKKSGIDHIYLQVYRAGKAYYDSSLADRSEFEKMKASSGVDPLKYILIKAGANDIKVFAWINCLSIAQNSEAAVLKKYGDAILAVDRRGKPSLLKEKDDLDRYYIRENQLFLEPGDKRVRDYVASIAAEIMAKYPGFDGIHLDYIRYPSIVPFVPGSRFDTHGLSYGYGETNTGAFRDSSGLDVLSMEPTRANYKKWDKWRRDQVTALVSDISRKIKGSSPDKKVSCAIMPTIERTYLVNFQDWTRWLKEGIVDYVVAMDYTDDTDLMELNAQSILISQLKPSIYIGLGAYLLKDQPETLEEEIDILYGLDPGGIVLFSYDDVAASEKLQEFLSSKRPLS